MRGVFVLNKNFIKRSLSIILFIVILFTNTIVFAIQDADEELGKEEFDEFLKLVTADVKKEPVINSRHAVVIERNTRKNIIWEKGKRKMQNG